MKKDTFLLCLTGIVIAMCYCWMKLFVIEELQMSSTTLFIPLVLLVYAAVLVVSYWKGK